MVGGTGPSPSIQEKRRGTMTEPEPRYQPSADASDGGAPPTPTAESDGIRELEELIQRGREILAVCGWNGRCYDAFRPGGIWVLKFRSRAHAALERLFGRGSAPEQAVHGWLEDPRAVDRGYYVPEILGALQDSYAGLCRERLFSAAPALLAAIADDVVEVAETLANAGDLVGGASRAAGIMRRQLGGLARRHLGPAEEVPSPPEIADALLERGIIDPSDHLKIGAYLQIARDLHGDRAAAIPDGELREMVRWVSELTRRFRW